jgi:hypothetical protein
MGRARWSEVPLVLGMVFAVGGVAVLGMMDEHDLATGVRIETSRGAADHRQPGRLPLAQPAHRGGRRGPSTRARRGRRRRVALPPPSEWRSSRAGASRTRCSRRTASTACCCGRPLRPGCGRSRAILWSRRVWPRVWPTTMTACGSRQARPRRSTCRRRRPSRAWRASKLVVSATGWSRWSARSSASASANPGDISAPPWW